MHSLLTPHASANNIWYCFLGTESTFACREQATEERIHGYVKDYPWKEELHFKEESK